MVLEAGTTSLFGWKKLYLSQIQIGSFIGLFHVTELAKLCPSFARERDEKSSETSETGQP